MPVRRRTDFAACTAYGFIIAIDIGALFANYGQRARASWAK